MSKRTRSDLTTNEKLEILDQYRKLPKLSQDESACRLGIKRGFLRNLIRDEAKLREQISGDCNVDRKRSRSGKDCDVESALWVWLKFARSRNVPVNGPTLCLKAELLARELGKDDFKATDGWLNRWKKRYGLTFTKLQGEAAEADEASADDWRKEHIPALLQTHSHDDIFNADETGFYYRALPDSTYILQKEKSTARGVKVAKDRITILVCCSMTGEKVRPLVIGKYANPRCLKNITDLPVMYKHSSNAWMTKTIWSDWLNDWDKKLRRQGRKILLLIDNCSAHGEVDGLTHIDVMRLPANTTSVLQPCDMGIIRTMKAYCRKEMRLQIIERIDDENPDGGPEEPSTSTRLSANDIAKKLNLLDAMHIIVSGWGNVSKETILNCWRKGGFVAGEISESEYNESSDVVHHPPGMSQEQFDAWVDADTDLPTAPELTFDEEEQRLFDQLAGRDTGEDETDQDDEGIEEPMPSNTEMRQCLRRLTLGLEQRRFKDMDTFRHISIRISEMLRESLTQKSIDDFFQPDQQ